MKPEKMTILNNNQQKLIGYLYPNTSKTLLIMCHGIDSAIGFPGKPSIISPLQSHDFYQKLQTVKFFLSVPVGDHALMKKEYEKITIGIPRWIKKQVVY